MKKYLEKLYNKLTNIVIKLIINYQNHISKNTLPSCRYLPTCSQYAIEAIKEWGIFIGLILALFRTMRCNPLFPRKVDMVPKRKRRHK